MKTKNFFILLFFTFLIIFFSSSTCTATSEISQGPNVSCGSAFLMDNNTTKVLYRKDENKRMFPASTTKILTAIIALENCNLNDVVTASYDAVMSVPEGYTSANIKIGETLTVEQLLDLMMVISANDAANVLAEHVAGSMNSFITMMNTKVYELGLKDTHFTNCFGLHDENHYTTAHDLAYIMRYCLKNTNFRKIAGKASCAIPETNLSGIRSYASTNELIVPDSSNYYQYTTSGKTGFTTEAKECLVSTAYKDNLELINVVLGSDNRFVDSIAIYKYAYSNFSIQNVVHEGDYIHQVTIKNATYTTKELNLLASETIPILIPNSINIAEIVPQITLNNNALIAPIEENSAVGVVSYTVNGITYSSKIVAAHDVQASKIYSYALYGCSGLIFLLLILGVLFVRNKNKKIDEIYFL